MGGNSSKTSVQQTNEFMTKITNSFVSENSQKVSAQSNNINAASFRGAKIKGCGVKVNQSITSDTVATGKMTVQNIQDLSTKLKSESAAAIDQQAKTSQGFLAPSFANKSTSSTDIKNKVDTVIDNTMKSSTVQDIFARANNTNDADFSNTEYTCYEWQSPEERTITVDQNIKATVVAKGVADALTQALAKDEVLGSLVTDVKQSATTESKGLDDLVSAIFSGLSGMYGVVALIVICCCCVCCCALIGVVGLGAAGGGGNGNVPKPPTPSGGVTLSAAPPIGGA
ncbi:hypothetical protein [Yellowstone lake phycodnavirus 3]|jgi:hypothetical protein|uniref:hypothetical protein n=1 Tax=Yellowstone lake phycodnavirus 3 TaxID=1586715 RepID=UPI0006EBD4FF|nr:hypothetical protein AR677_gp188 [Yellowstone lake phycodnavirus 3]BAT22687.1 hypothetical protein [Yellowstone lake phycodnavirus 3]